MLAKVYLPTAPGPKRFSLPGRGKTVVRAIRTKGEVVTRNKLIKRAAAALAVKEIIDRVQEARAPKKSFLRRNSGKLALLGLAGAGFYIYQQQRAGQISLPGATTGTGGFSPTREPAIEPDERIDSRLPSDTSTRSPQPTR